MDLDVDNETDPVADKRFPNIVAFDPDLDDLSESEMPCCELTLEEVHPDG